MSDGPEFFQTVMGRRYYEHTMPELVRQLARIADALEWLATADGAREPRPAPTTPPEAPAPPPGQDGAP